VKILRKYDAFRCYDKRLVSTTQYVVKPGDTLYKIAQASGMGVEDLISANNLQSSLIYPNQIIVIPKEVPSGAVYFEEYIISDGDTIESIAEKMGVRIDLLTKYNDITKLMLVENQSIIIPRTFDKYTIVLGDTVESILDEFNMTLEQLVYANVDQWFAPGNTINVR